MQKKVLLDDLRGFGLQAENRNEWLGEAWYSFDVSCQGLLYNGRDRTKGIVRVVVNLRQYPLEFERELISSEYDDVRPLVAALLTLEHLPAEKVRGCSRAARRGMSRMCG